MHKSLGFLNEVSIYTILPPAVPDTSSRARLLSLLAAQTQSRHAPEINLRDSPLVTALFLFSSSEQLSYTELE